MTDAADHGPNLDELHRLLGDYCHGTISEADGARYRRAARQQMPGACSFTTTTCSCTRSSSRSTRAWTARTLAAKIADEELNLAAAALMHPPASRMPWLALAATLLAWRWAAVAHLSGDAHRAATLTR